MDAEAIFSASIFGYTTIYKLLLIGLNKKLLWR